MKIENTPINSVPNRHLTSLSELDPRKEHQVLAEQKTQINLELATRTHIWSDTV